MAITTIQINAADFLTKANKAIGQKKRIKLVLKGTQAFSLGEALRRGFLPRNAPRDAGASIAIVAAIVIGVIAVMGMAVLASVLLYGISKGYKIKAHHKVKGPLPFDDELYFDLQPPAR